MEDEQLSRMETKIDKLSEAVVAMNAPKAAFGIVDVLDNPSSLGARNAISEAREVLDRTG